MPNLKSDITIIGAGPTGSASARIIAENGFDVILVEKDVFPKLTNVCAGGTLRSVIKNSGLNLDIIEKEIKSEKHYFPWGENIVEINLTMVHLFSGKDTIESNLVIFADGPNTLAYRKFGIGFKHELDTVEILQRSSALIPAAPAKKIFDECMVVVGDAAAMVDPVTRGGIIYAINGGKLAGKTCALSLEEEDFSAKFVYRYQTMWHKTIDYSWIYIKFLALDVFLYLNIFDNNAYPKLAAITREGVGKALKRMRM